MRLDLYLVEKGYFDSRTKAKQAIERGEVYLDNTVISKSSLEISEDKKQKINIVSPESFVSLGGYKLNKALNSFMLDVNGLMIADIGASTGGFTDCALQRGAKKVYAVDLNDSLLSKKLQKDDRVVPIIKNARDLRVEDFNDRIDLIVADLSFISATYVLETFSKLIDDEGKIILLIKPQFEIFEKRKFKNGIVKDTKLHREICENIFSYAHKCNLFPIGFTSAPKTEGKNIEFLVLFSKNEKDKLIDISSINYS